MTHGNTTEQVPERHRMQPLDVNDQRLNGLIGACATGTESAFEQLYKLTSSQLFGVLRRILKTDALAEEALQDTYVKIWNNAERYQSDKSAPRTWLVSIARNHAIDVLRKRRSREDVELNMDSASIDTMPDREQPMDQQLESSQLLNLCLQQLSRPARECVIRAYCEGFSQEELSQRLQRPIGTVKSWIRRSLVSLKDCLDDHA
ncbi:sigma-70 family RNA polymerase sigma factor [Granulosicoccus antarcticus]|uniref:ECF RNA polymerase sigma factor SigK n=1 Tax=Granulosicoccus antarcticus IMCC3135 TaxID=1192854 RepID=A0A2Z2NZJ6_9GAMM|nr:sigma-70 family RNA polymerase sigma factor [Granulosicoccus antarcticus]ASJ75855.1 ECF RNA polymerase sigma factor SigK [Granulosicoccus antarcticus IMCC3135]